MNEMKHTQTEIFFANHIAHCKARAAALANDGREDESVFSKVETNVFEIFQTIYSVARKTAGQDDEKAVQFFMAKLKQIPESWRTALANAQQHDELQKAHIEKVKLEAAEVIRQQFTQIWEGSL